MMNETILEENLRKNNKNNNQQKNNSQQQENNLEEIEIGQSKVNGIKKFQRKPKQVNLAFTHDLHSHIDCFKAVENGEVGSVGGFARMKTLLEEIREVHPETLLLDGGDFSMGTLFQTAYKSKATELRMLGLLGFDATTLGNHEFDYKLKGIIGMLQSAHDSKDRLPSIVIANIDLKYPKREQADFKRAMELCGVKSYAIFERAGVKIAVFGMMGKDAINCAPNSGINFIDPMKAAKEIIVHIKKMEKVDMIVCLSHGGTSSIKKLSEDEILAREVPEIDVIISAHTHTTLEKPIVIGHTVIVSCGEYGRNLGKISLKQDKDKRWSIDDYELVPITSKIKEDKSVKEKIEEEKRIVEKNYLSQYGYTFEQVLAYNPYPFASVREIEEEHKENTFGNLIADAYIHTIKEIEGDSYEDIHMAVVPSGLIRESFTIGDITAADVFNCCSLGIGKDGTSGYPLISTYLTGKEIKIATEIDASLSSRIAGIKLYMSGVHFVFNPNRLILNKVTDTYFSEFDRNREEIKEDKLYRVVSDIYTGQMLAMVSNRSKGILSIVPKDKKGRPIMNLEDHIIMDGRKELKAWSAVARYLESFPRINNKPRIPEYYNSTHGRKVIVNSKKISELIKKPNKVFKVVSASAGVATVLAGFFSYSLVKEMRHGFTRNKQY